MCYFPRFFFLLLLVLSMTATSSSLQDKLWLPVSYQAHFVRLFESAEKVIDLDECYQFLSGTLDEKRSTRGSLVFSFRCRDSERNIFTVLVNASNLKVTKMSDIWLESREREKEAEKQRKLRKRLG